MLFHHSRFLTNGVIFNSSCPHITPKPGTSGKIIWLSGPPGAGKSTTCQLMARSNDYIYYEADCVFEMVNPFTDLHVDNPTMASMTARPLKVITRIDGLALKSYLQS